MTCNCEIYEVCRECVGDAEFERVRQRSQAATEKQPCETCKGDGCCPTCHGAGELIESLREQLRDAEFNNFRV